jgi:hypothetical protein
LQVWWFYEYVDWINDIYILTPDQIMDIYRTPLGREDKKTAPWKISSAWNTSGSVFWGCF